LGNSYVRTQVNKIVYTYLKEYFAANTGEFDKMFEKIDLAARARLAAKLAKETVIRKNVLSSAVMP
jgi:DNA gyrase subunit B